MSNTDHLLGNTSLKKFLHEYWQQKPLLIRQALPHYCCPISPDEMAGLACEAEVDSRIILERDGDHAWQCRNGPFAEDDFAQLPESHWILLLQACNIHIPAMAELLDCFRFIPNWRVDDIMMSYAPIHGSVGPHTDNYDVFLLQAQGRRHWQISNTDYQNNDFLPDLDLKILKSFSPQQSWTLEPGDMLYLPPGVAHHGVALDECITISVGFRAPNLAELTAALLDQLMSSQSSTLEQRFYQDPDLPWQENSGEISAQALKQINTMVSKELFATLQQADWFGSFITDTQSNEPPEPIEPPLAPVECLQLVETHPLIRNENCKLAFYQDKHGQLHFYVNGTVEYYPQELQPFIALICNSRYPELSVLKNTLKNKDAQRLFCELINQGHLYFEEDDELE